MSYSKSQEQTIYHKLAEQIQLGFYSDGQRFPTAQEIASQFHVSYCPAQRALKLLERDGLIHVCRGKETQVLAKPYAHYLESQTFQERTVALADLCQSLQLISPSITYLGMCHLDRDFFEGWTPERNDRLSLWKNLYRRFSQIVTATGSQTLQSLYYDIGAFTESLFLDAFHTLYEETEEIRLLQQFTLDYQNGFQSDKSGALHTARRRLEQLCAQFFGVLTQFLNERANQALPSQKAFLWTPHKGRTRYQDLIAIDLICKINRGLYPVGSYLPNRAALADIYHVSAITIRRTIELMNACGITWTINGVGTQVLRTGDASLSDQLKPLMLDEHSRTFLEALQAIAVTCEPVLVASISHFTEASLHAIAQAMNKQEQTSSVIATMSACVQAIVRCCPLAAIRELYAKLTPLLLSGNFLQLRGMKLETLPDWPERAHTLAKALIETDDKRFALTFREMVADIFAFTKGILLKAGVANIEQVASPVFPDESNA